MYKLILFAGILFSGTVILNSCSKSNGNPVTPATQVIFDRDLLISSATDSSANVTSHFSGITFHFTGPYTALTGNATAANTLVAVSGSWSTNATYNKITFTFPTTIFSDLAYLNKQWLIADPSANPLVLTATNGETDVLQFSIK